MKNCLQCILLLMLPLCSLGMEGFVIKGKVTGVKNGTAAIVNDHPVPGEQLELADPVRIVNGEFTYFGKLDRPRLLKLKVSTRMVNVFLENAYYEINCSLDSLHGSKLEGGTLNTQYWDFMKAPHTDMQADIKAVIKTGIGPFLANMYTRDRKDVEELYPLLTEAGKNTYEGKEYRKKYDGFINSAAGKSFPKLKMNLPNGQPFTEKEMAGKVVVFDFWASWCAPCIAYIPQMREHYNHLKGLDVLIVSISVDDTDAAWRKAMKAHPMEWTQVLSDGGFYKGEAKRRLSIPSIPYVIVVDKQGNIAATLDFDQKKDLEQVVLKALQQQ
ncbi:TlpA disulfide reductase family protein [Chitinophaga pollutisoli]|uniref:TlpA disulfide reductase family protein n=1 Tax=Chitinophaga pollutisoli TaxID=3133966 RepID=A0ABZ2YTL4_9BACT